jgi:putative membrane protein
LSFDLRTVIEHLAPLVKVLAVLVAVEHLWFLVLEMFLWTKPLGLKTFRSTPEFAAQSAALAANQGLYNGFLAAGLVWGVVHPDAHIGLQILCFFFACVTVAGVYGGMTVSRRITLLQGGPGLLGLVLAGLVRAAV